MSHVSLSKVPDWSSGGVPIVLARSSDRGLARRNPTAVAVASDSPRFGGLVLDIRETLRLSTVSSTGPDERPVVSEHSIPVECR